MNRVNRLGFAYSSRYTPAAIPTGNDRKITNNAMINEPHRPWLTPTRSGSDPSSLRRNPKPRLSNTGIACANTSHIRMISISNDSSRHASSATMNTIPRTSRLPPVSALRTAS
jgi:hypothetical protein